MKKEVTIKDIAKELGIHHATVSRALQGSTKINENTRNMILQAAREMGYTPNILAQNFRNGKTKVISFIIPDLKHHFFSRIISMITEMAREKGAAHEKREIAKNMRKEGIAKEVIEKVTGLSADEIEKL